MSATRWQGRNPKRRATDLSNGRQHALTAPIRFPLHLFFRAALGQCFTSCQHTDGTRRINSAYGQETKAEGHNNMGPLSRSTSQRATHNEREIATLLHPLSQSILVNPHMW